MLPQQNKKKKTDYVALNSPFMRIPRMNVAAARALLDINIKEIYELIGRDPESIFADYKKFKTDASNDLIKYFKIAIDFSEKNDI